MFSGRPGPAALECAIDMWGRTGNAVAAKAAPGAAPQSVDEDAITAAAKKLGEAKRPMIICGGGAQDSLRRNHATVRNAAGAGARPIAAAAACSMAASPLRVTLAARSRTLGRSRCGPGGRHPYVSSSTAMGHRQQSGCDPHRRRPGGADPRASSPRSRCIGDAKPILMAAGRHGRPRTTSSVHPDR